MGVDLNWHSAANWSLVSGGAGGAGVPTLSDDVFIDGNGFVLCWAAAPIACNNLTLEATATESVILDQGGVIAGDFTEHAGYFGPTGGGGYTLDFQGNWLFDGGSFSVGTGTGVDPTCEFSGTGKTFANNHTGTASFQNVLVSGEITVSGTKLSQMAISQKLGITGTMTVNKYGVTTICRVNLTGANAGFDVLTGTLAGTGRLYWTFKDGDVVPTTGTISIRYFRLAGKTGQVSGTIAENLYVDGWTDVHNDWSHQGTEPWIDGDDGDANYITLPAVAGSVGLYDEEYTVENIDSDDWTSISMTNVKIHLKGRLYDGVGGHALFVAVRAYLWDGAVWQDAGTALFLATSYADRSCSGNLSASFGTIAKLDGMKLKLEIDTVQDGGADKGGINITQAWVELDGTSYRNPIFVVAPRTWTSPCEVELEYTDDLQTFRFGNGQRHYFGNKLTIHCDEAGVDEALLDWATYTAFVWVNSIFNIYKDAFPSAIFTIRLGDGTHVFRGSVDFYFSYSSGASTQLVVDPGEGTIILWPRGRQLVLL